MTTLSTLRHATRRLRFGVALAGLAGSCLAGELADHAGYPEGAFESESVSGPSLAWEAFAGEGPDGGDCLASGLVWNAGDPSIVQLTVSGPGILSFDWLVSSAENDGILSCQLGQAGGIVELGRISGDDGEWKSMEVFVPQGDREVRWIYRKKTFLSAGDDWGKLANVDFVPIAAAAQDFDAYRQAHGVSGPGRTRVAGRRLDASWLMGLAPDEPMPAGVLEPEVLGEEVRIRMRFGLAADGLITPEIGDELGAWSAVDLRSSMVPGSLTADSVMFDFHAPAGSRRFFRARYQARVDPPSAEYAYLPAGRFLAGSPPSEVGRLWSGYLSGNWGPVEDNLREVTLTRGFFMKKHETTWAEWVAVKAWGEANGYGTLGSGDEARGGRHLLQDEGGNILHAAPAADSDPTHPVTNVGFYDALRWLNAKSEMDGLEPCYSVTLDAESGGATVVWRDTEIRGGSIEAILCDWEATGYRLPTEHEWEYACRAGTPTALNNNRNLSTASHYPSWPLPGAEASLNDPNLDPVASYFGNTAATHPVGSRAPNAFGLFDMHGNASEWCWDLYDRLKPAPYFTGEALEDPRGPDLVGGYRVLRGGDWRNPGHMLRSASRQGTPAGGGNHHGEGFRYLRRAAE